MKDKISLSARLVYFYLTHFNYHKRYSFEENIRYLEKIKSLGEQPYSISRNIKFNCKVDNFTFNNIKVYNFNSSNNTNTIILYLYGGGFVSRPVKYQLKMINKIIKMTDAQVIMPLYPLLPFHTFDECYDVLIELYKLIIEKNNNKKIIILGDSAGGTLACGLCEYFSEHNIQTPDYVFLLSPALDLSMTNPLIDEYQKKDPMSWKPLLEAWAYYWSGKKENLTNYLVSPLYGNVKGFPPTHMYIATNDLLYPDAKLFADKLRENDVDLELVIGSNLCHVWPAHPISEAKATLKEIANVINNLSKSLVNV